MKTKNYLSLLVLPLVFLLYTFQKSNQPLPEKFLGVRTIEYMDTSRERPITIELWYPTEEKQTSHKPLDNHWIHPKEIRNAKISGQQIKYPLLLMSHGHNGDRRERSWLAETLVKEGYIIAAVDHYGDTRSTFNPLLSICFWNRPLDISFSLDQLLKDPLIANYIDPDRIGFIGYSLGGMTGLGLAGAKAVDIPQPILKSLGDKLNIQSEALSLIDFSPCKKSYLEPRIKSMLLICPAIFIYSTQTLKNIKIPIGLIATIGDEVLPHKNHAYQIIKHAIPSKLKIMRKEVSHYSFLNRRPESEPFLFESETQRDPPSLHQTLIHKEAGLFASDFFNETLKN